MLCCQCSHLSVYAKTKLIQTPNWGPTAAGSVILKGALTCITRKGVGSYVPLWNQNSILHIFTEAQDKNSTWHDFVLLACYCCSTVVSFTATQQLFPICCSVFFVSISCMWKEKEEAKVTQKWTRIIVLTADMFIYVSNDYRVSSFWCINEG